jgi:transcriptional regulator with XRE-family HTH domain
MMVEVVGMRAIRRIRKNLGLPIRVVAARAGIGEVFLSEIERGQRKDLRVSTLRKIVKALAVLSARPEQEILLEVFFQDNEDKDTNAPVPRGR